MRERAARDPGVFNDALAAVVQGRAGGWEVPADRSWHGEAFFWVIEQGPDDARADLRYQEEL